MLIDDIAGPRGGAVCVGGKQHDDEETQPQVHVGKLPGSALVAKVSHLPQSRLAQFAGPVSPADPAQLELWFFTKPRSQLAGDQNRILKCTLAESPWYKRRVKAKSVRRCLLVGAGAVGQVYGYHLHRGGARVAYYVKPKYAAAVREGFALYPLNQKGVRNRPVRFAEFETLTEIEDVRRTAWDEVFLCISSTALRGGDWFAPFVETLGDATVVTLQVGLHDLEFIARHVPAERVVTGLIGLMSYAAPLEGETVVEAGTAYWCPPLVKCPFSGERARIDPIISTLRKGRFPASRHKDVQVAAVFGSALLQTQIYALECAGWDIGAMRADRDLMRSGHRAMREATAVGARLRGVRYPLTHRLLGPWSLGKLLSVTALLAPLNVERFFEFHYTKVRDQSMDMLANWIKTARSLDIEPRGLEDLQRRLQA